MCVGKECGTFRVYEISEITAVSQWSGTSGKPPADEGRIFSVNDLGSERSTNEAKAKFAEGINNRWGTPAHSGEACKNGCRCVKTTEEVGEGSENETRPWRQPMTLSNGAKIIVRGTYKKKFKDYKGKCDADDEVGQPISWEKPKPRARKKRKA